MFYKTFAGFYKLRYPLLTFSLYICLLTIIVLNEHFQFTNLRLSNKLMEWMLFPSPHATWPLVVGSHCNITGSDVIRPRHSRLLMILYRNPAIWEAWQDDTSMETHLEHTPTKDFLPDVAGFWTLLFPVLLSS